MINKIVQKYNKFEEVLLILSLVVTVCLIFWQIVMRWVFNDSLTWSEELARYLFIWQIWLGTSIGFRDDKHISITIIRDKFKGKSLAVFNIIARSILLAFCVFLVVMGMQMVDRLFTTNYLSAALRIPMYLVYFSLPFSSFIVCLRIIGKMINDFKILIGKPVPCLPDQGIKEGI
ncbi:MAG: TRAP transporter small permease [Clostridia bacterium]|nr:TRAP transporter small permease [Clostridia bacterium]